MPKKYIRILIFIVAYNAEKHIENVLARIPEKIWHPDDYEVEILIIDDGSSDHTAEVGSAFSQKTGRPVHIMRNPVNQGYGGNQKIGYTYAIEKNFDIVVLLHGDGQYPPEKLPELLAPLMENKADAVFGSRMLRKCDALKGGMPFYKFCGNIILTTLQNWLLGTRLSELHTGYRAYSTSALKRIPFQYNSNNFDYDTDIIIQLVQNNFRIKELPIPTHYGDEISHVNGFAYAWNILKSTVVAGVQRYGIYYNPKFDYDFGVQHYDAKTHFDSSHRFAIAQIKPDSVVLDFGCGKGYVDKILKEKGCNVYGFDHSIQKEAEQYCVKVTPIDFDRFNFDFDIKEEKIDAVLLLDVLEYITFPELFLRRLRTAVAKHRPEIIITTANVAFITLRFSMLLGQFNYGKRGILDLTHKRLFTFSSLLRLLHNEGYDIEIVKGIPVPIPLILGDNAPARLLLAINNACIRLRRGLFSFQIAIVAKPAPTLDMLLEKAETEGKKIMRTQHKK